MKKHTIVPLAALVLSLAVMAISPGPALTEEAHSLRVTEAPEYVNELPPGAYEMAVTAGSVHAARILLTTGKPLKNFSIVAIEYVPDDRPGHAGLPAFKKTRTLYSLPLFSPGKPLYAVVEMMGSIPNIAVTWAADGNRHELLALSQSGADGTFLLHAVRQKEK